MYNNKKCIWEKKMKPRVFVSSTFYDLKYIREDLSNYIAAHDFEPVLFENGDIGYTPGKTLDQSCYDQMKSTDMVILIVGGNYGSPASGEKEDDFEEYMSVTRKEFQTAVNTSVPVFVFIDSTVYSEFGVYEANLEQIEEKRVNINFKSTKSINVFRFIREIKNIGNIAITEFRKATDIKDFLSKQWSDMFKTYLSNLRKESENNKLVDAVEELRTFIKQMDVMLDTVGQKVLSENNGNAYNVALEKKKIVSLADKIAQGFSFENFTVADSKEKREKNLNKFLEVLKYTIDNEKWTLLQTFNEKDVMQFFEIYKNKGLMLRDISVGIMWYSSEIDHVLENQQDRTILLEELLKDDNYLRLIYVKDDQKQRVKEQD